MAKPRKSSAPPAGSAAFDAQWSEMYSQMLAHLPKGIVWGPPLPPFFTGYSYGTLWDWDQYFEGITQLYAGFPTDYIKNAIRIFLSRQWDSGMIYRQVPPGGGETYFKHRVHVKPFLAQLALLVLHAEGNLDWLRVEDRYDRLRKYLVFWLENRDVRGAGLSVWEEAGHTGMDNHYERAGEYGKEMAFCEGVDLNAYLVRECRAMSVIAAAVGRKKDIAFFKRCADLRAKAIQRDLWCEEDGLYYDRHAKKDEPIRVKYVGAFFPMWAGVATQKQARRLVNEHLLNEREFWRPYPVPALAATEPGYAEGFLEGHNTGCCSWRAHTWVPTNYMAFQGLRAYGFNEVARELADRTWRMFLRGRFCEYYVTESGIGTGLKPFWGWSCLAVFMRQEMELGVDPTRLAAHSGAVAAMRRRIARALS